MRVHWFLATRLGWDKKQDVVWFEDTYTKDEAIAEFRPVEKETLKANNRWYPYTAYEYDGVQYHDFEYMGECDFEDLPR